MAAIGDFYTWKLAVRVYGNDSPGSWTTVCDYGSRSSEFLYAGKSAC